ncbi:AMP-binding domain containing protein [Asbolus verrucosus]|uniref:Luciferin 4-monooxygenase n=1 Tax=Asbolus verrucosus TaxID=1661398 RepID=A0A482VQ64_ASBVE|nr:AMP-binding domain containing protein [Asbolus verrucosus]
MIFCTSKTLVNIVKIRTEPFIPKNIVIYDDETSEDARNFDTLLKHTECEESFSPVELDPKKEVALILTSSGTTGVPKCVMLTHASVLVNMDHNGNPLVFDLNPQESVIAFLPFFHIFGQCLTLGSILHGSKFVILDKFVPDRFLQTIQDHRITKLFAVPPILLFLVKSPLSIRQAYALTEFGAATIIPKDVKKCGSVGKPIAGVKIKVCNVETGKVLPPNQIGELRMFGDGVMKGYLGNDEESKAAFDEDGFLRSGDLGYYDEEGFYYIVDRLKEIINYKGFQVSPAELENLLIQHPAVKDAGVIGIPKEGVGEVPLAFIVKQPNTNVTEDEIVHYIEENISVQKRLYGGVKFIEEIPKSPSGKILRRKLKELLDTTIGEEVTYGKLLKLSVKLAVELTKLGVKKGDVITIVSQNHWKYLLTVIAAFYIGAKVSLLNHDYTATMIFCTSKTLVNILKIRTEPFIPKNIVIYDDETSEDARNFDTLLKHTECEESFGPVELDPKKEVALILTSSGTTGFPKCVMLTHASILVSMVHAGDPLVIDLNPQESVIAFLPFFHIFGQYITLGSILHGSKFVILDKFVPDRFLQTIQDHRITKLFAVPPILLFLVKSPLVEKYDVSSITNILCGAASISQELEKMVEKRLKLESIRQAYALTEFGAATIIPKDVKKCGSIGKPIAGVKIKVCDVETGKALPPNQIGELRMFGDGVMKGYLGNDEESKAAFDEDGFLRSGDLGYYDEEGFYYIVDRLKEIINYKGFQVSPAELENLLIQHPAVKDAGVIGIPKEGVGEVPLAFIVKQPDTNVTEEEIVHYIEENISVQKRLYGGVKFIDDIPKNPSGKILRRKLKELV